MNTNDKELVEARMSISDVLFTNGYYPNGIFNITKANLLECIEFLEKDGFVNESELLEKMFLESDEFPRRVTKRIHISGDGSPAAMAECIRSLERERNMSTEDKMLRDLLYAHEVMKKCHDVAKKYTIDMKDPNWLEDAKNPGHQDMRDISVTLDLALLTLKKWTK